MCICVCVCLCGFVYMSKATPRGQKREMDPLNLQLCAVLNCLIRVMGFEC